MKFHLRPTPPRLDASDGRHATILVVSEDPELIHRAHGQLSDHYHVIGCTGPVQSPCNLETKAGCPLALHASIAMVDSPLSGVFRCHSKTIAAGTYAEGLQRAHPGCTVILCGAPAGLAVPSGEVVTAASALSVIKLLEELGDVSTGRLHRKGDRTCASAI